MIAILDAFSGISGDMTLGALVDVGLDRAWLLALPVSLGLDGVTVRIENVQRGEIACTKVDFDVPPQPHGRHLAAIERMIDAVDMPALVREQSREAFRLIATEEARIHATTVERVHLHEVGAVDAILDVVGAVWGFERLGVSAIYCGPLSVGDGFVTAAHGLLPVPAPATMRLLEGLSIRPGPPGSGELVTPTGAALVRVLSEGPPPAEYVPRRSGYGAGARDPKGRANALRLILAERSDAPAVDSASLIVLAADLDDMSPEYVAAAADAIREAGALDVVLIGTVMKKGRAGTRIEALATEAVADVVAAALFAHTSTNGVRRWAVSRHALRREERIVSVAGHTIRVKLATLPDGRRRGKPEYDDVLRVAAATGRPAQDIFAEAVATAGTEAGAVG